MEKVLVGSRLSEGVVVCGCYVLCCVVVVDDAMQRRRDVAQGDSRLDRMEL